MSTSTLRDKVKEFWGEQMRKSRETAKTSRVVVRSPKRSSPSGTSIRRSIEVLKETGKKSRPATVEEAMQNILKYGDPILKEALERELRGIDK